MARPKKENRDDVAGFTLTVRATKLERDLLDKLVACRKSQLGPYGANLTASIVLRALIQEAAQAAGLLPLPAQTSLQLSDAQPVPSLAPVAAAPVAAPKSKASPSKGRGADDSADPLRDRYVAARAAGKIGNKEVADACGFADGSSVSRWASGKGTLAPAHRATIERLLRNRA